MGQDLRKGSRKRPDLGWIPRSVPGDRGWSETGSPGRGERRSQLRSEGLGFVGDGRLYLPGGRRAGAGEQADRQPGEPSLAPPCDSPWPSGAQIGRLWNGPHLPSQGSSRGCKASPRHCRMPNSPPSLLSQLLPPPSPAWPLLSCPPPGVSPRNQAMI